MADVTTRIDDLDNDEGNQIPADRRVVLSLGDQSVVLDLTEEHYNHLHLSVQSYLDAGTPLRPQDSKPKKRSAPTHNSNTEAAALRRWAETQDDIVVNPRGRIPQNLWDRYHERTGQ
jgi:hypothetical protein